jgi:hypothetical protein
MIMKTQYYLAVFGCFFMFSCNNEKEEPNTRSDVKKEVATTSEICFPCTNIEAAADAYDYPLKAGTVEYGNTAPNERWLLNQVPEVTLKSMSTMGLIQSLLTFPGNHEWVFSNDIYGGFIYRTQNITICPELFSRSNAASKLLEVYKVFDQDCDLFFNAVLFIELLFAQPEIYTKLTDNEIIELFETAFDKTAYLEKITEPEETTGWYEPSKYLFFARIMNYVGYEPFVQRVFVDESLQHFLETESDGDFLVTPSYFEGGYVKCRDFITSCAKDFVNKNK